MLEFRTEIGFREKHTIDFQFNQTWKSLQIKIDGKTVVNKAMNLRFRESKRYTFEIGNEETHEIRIDLVKSLFPIGYGECTAYFYVDGEKTEEYTGKTSHKDRLFSGVGFLPTASVIAAFVLILSLIIGYTAYIIPIRINRTLDGVLIMTGDSMPDFIEHEEIKIEGYYYRKLFKMDEFLGDFVINKYLPEQTDGDFSRPYNVFLQKFGKNTGRGHLYYTNDIEFGEFKMIRAGTVVMDPRGETVMIFFEEKTGNESHHWSSGDGLIYVAPAEDRQKALSIGNSFFEVAYGDSIIPME